MIKLTVGNSLSQIVGLSIPEFKTLRDALSYTPSGSYFAGGHGSGKRYLLDKKGQFPTGLLYLVEGFLRGRTYESTDLRRRPAPAEEVFTLSLPFQPYQEQIEAADACKAAGRGIVCAPTGLGKSVIISLIVERMQVPTLIVVPSLELKRQLTASLKAAFGEVMVGGYGFPVAVENVDALSTDKPVPYDCVIIDEFHHSAAATYRKLNLKAWKDVYHRFGLTATPFRANESERLLLESLLSQVIYRIEYKTAVEKGYIVPLEVYYFELPIQEMKGNEDSWAAVYSELVVNNAYRNALIAFLMEGLAHVPTLTLVKEIKHGEELSRLTGVPFANGQDGNTRMRVLELNLGEINRLIGTTGVIGEGVDTKRVEWGILAAGGKSKTAFMQQLGRMFRVSPGKESGKAILFRDRSHKWLDAHFKAQVKILKEEYGIKPVKLEVPVHQG